MLELIDGPCKGHYLCKRAPRFLRAVKKKNGDTDVLDQVEDKPASNETVYVYKIKGEAGQIHIQARGKGGKALSGFYAMASYEYMPEIDGQTLRDNKTWQEWAVEHSKLYFPGG